MAKGVRTSVGDAREMLRQAEELVELINEVEHRRERLRHSVETAFTALREQMVRRELANIPATRLRDTTDGRLCIGPLEQAGFPTVLEVYDSWPGRLQRIPGVGDAVAGLTLGGGSAQCALPSPGRDHGKNHKPVSRASGPARSRSGSGASAGRMQRRRVRAMSARLEDVQKVVTG